VVFYFLEQRCQLCFDLVKMLQRPVARRTEGLGGLCFIHDYRLGAVQINNAKTAAVFRTQHTQLMLAVPAYNSLSEPFDSTRLSGPTDC
jgi:hypothetical protein